MRVLNCVIILIYWFSCCSADELIAVTALVRHGARLPETLYPTDPYKNYSWPFVMGDLTNDGINEMYHVGRWLKERYTPFLSVKYNPEEVYAQSIDYDRCISTGGATMAGLFPPTQSETWNKHIRWQPVPIHVSPIWQDIVIDMSVCPKIPEESGVIRGTKRYFEIMTQYQDYFDYITSNSGQLINFSTMYPLFDTLFSELKMNLQLPKWAQKIYPQMLPLIVEYTKMDSMIRPERIIQVGPMLGRILNQFDSAIKGEHFGTTKTIYRKFMTYFATEWILYDMTYSLGLPDINIPDFGAIYLVELKKSSLGQYYVNILYRHSSALDTKAVPAPINGLNFNLDYAEFKNYVKPYLANSTEWVRICEDFSNHLVQVDTSVPTS